MFGVTANNLDKALRDILGGFAAWRLWHLLAWQEIQQRYRRSSLGPFWLTLSMAVTIATMGTMVTWLFGHSFNKFMPYITASIIMWTLISGIITDGSNSFIASASYITQIRRPLTTYLMRTVWQGLIIMAHNMIVLVIVSIIFAFPPNANILLLFVSLPLAILSVSWAGLFLATISARFRDVPVMVANAFTVLFWLTPIFYYPDQLKGLKRTIIVDFNPFSHILEIVRSPLLGTAPSALNWTVVIGITVFGWGFTLLFYARFRSRIAYWL